MSSLIDEVIKCAEAGLSVLPTKGTPGDAGVLNRKAPALATWKPLQQDPLTPAEIRELWAGRSIRDDMTPTGEIAGFGIVCGEVSGGVECIDVDPKNDPSGTVWADLKAMIAMDDLIGGIFKELYTEQTPSTGAHLVYRYENPAGSKRAGNVTLARSKDRKAIIETRGEGGYFAAAPTPGYEATQGTLADLPVLTKRERDRLHEICRSLCYLTPAGTTPEAKPSPEPAQRDRSGVSPFEQYNVQATPETVRDLLIKHGWTVKGTDRDGRTRMLRPDNGQPSTAPHSGNILMYGTPPVPLFSVFTTSALPFEPYKRDQSGAETNDKRSYTPVDVYTLIEHDGDYKAAGRALYRAGYGDRRSPTDEVPAGLITVSYVNTVTGENIVICYPGGELRKQDVKDAPVTDFTIGAEADTPEILQAIKLIQAAKRYAYVQIAEGEEIRDYRYVAQALLNKYGEIQEREGGLSDRHIDRLSADIVKARQDLRIADRPGFIAAIMSSGIQETTGITEESLTAAGKEIERQTSEDGARRSIEESMRKVGDLLSRGKPFDAARAMMDQARSITKDALDLEKLLEPYGRDLLRDEIQRQPADVPTGFTFRPINNKGFELMVPAGALTVIAARTGHRKTSTLMNMAVNMARDPRVTGEVYFMTYEEARGELVLKMMNIDINRPLQEGSRRNLSYIKAYYEKGTPENSFNNKDFREGEQRFFSDLIDTGRLRVIDPRLTAPDLCQFIERIKEEGRPAAIMIDYIQQLRIPDLATQSRQVQLQEICELLRTTAIKTGLPLILGAQFNREVQQEMDIESAKIREAGDIEQTANLVIGLWDRKQTRANHKGRDGKTAKYAEDELYAEILKGRGVGTGAYAEMKYNAGTWKIVTP